MRRPPLTQNEKELIASLRGERGWSFDRIACKLDRAVGSISWFCLQEGIEKRGVPPLKRGRLRVRVYQRGDRIVRHFSEQEDRALIAMRLDGKTPTEIGRKLARRPNSITGRLMTLARHEAM